MVTAGPYASVMGWNLGVLRCELPPGATNLAELAGDVLPIGARAEVHAVLAQLLPGYVPEGEWGHWMGRDFAVEIFIHPGDPVAFVGLTPRGDAGLAIEPVFAFAERFGAWVFCLSDCEILTRQTAHAHWARFGAWRDRVLHGD